MRPCIYNYKCLSHVDWSETTNKIMKLFDEKTTECPLNQQSDDQEPLKRVYCPIKNFIQNQSESENRIHAALVLSKDAQVRKTFSMLFRRIHVNYLFESTLSKSIIRILELDIKLMIIDYCEHFHEYRNILKVIKKIRPRLPIMALVHQGDDELYTELHESGVRFILNKPLRPEKIMDFIIHLNPV
jgi:hypothetical protein